MNLLDRVFDNLDRWSHLPDYQLQPRVDVFFSVYLKGLVEEVTGVALEEEMLPELPIKRDLIWSGHPSNKSVTVDYALFSKDRYQVFFVELTTDPHARREDRDVYLQAARGLGFRKIAQGICDLVRKTSTHQKYHHLASALTRLGYISMPHDLAEFAYPVPRPGLRERLDEIRVTTAEALVDVLYVRPAATEGERCITFRQFAEYVARHDDPLSQAFARYLQQSRTPTPLSVQNEAPITLHRGDVAPIT
jgi:hypothetical protein